MKRLLELCRRTPWFIRFSRYCQVSGLLAALMLIVRVAHSGLVFADGSIQLEITRSAFWADLLLRGFYLAFAGCGAALAFIRPEARKPALIGLVLWCALAPVKDRLQQPFSDLLVLSLPTVLGVWGALFERLRGRTAREEWLKKLKPIPHYSQPVPLPKRDDPKPTLRDYAVVLFLLFVAVTLWSLADVAVRSGSGYAWAKFAGIGLLLLVIVFYVSALRRADIAPAVLMSRFIAGQAFLIILLYAGHVFLYPDRAAAWRTLNIDSLAASPLWTDHALLGAIAVFSGLSILLTLKRRETRAAVLAALPLCAWLFFITIRFHDIHPAFFRRTHLDDLIIFLWPLFAGINALLFPRWFGESAANEWHARLANKRKPASPLPAGPNPAVPRSTVPTLVFPKSPAAAGQKTPVPPFPPRPAPHPPAPPVSREQQLTALKEEYLKKRASSRQLTSEAALLPQLERASGHLFPGTATLATLGGQRQLLMMLTSGIPCLRPLLDEKEAAKLMRPSLPDDPERFVPLLNVLVSRAAGLLNDGMWEQEKEWQALSPEALAGGWYALRMYRRMSSQPEVFELAADGLTQHMSRRPDVTAWLKDI